MAIVDKEKFWRYSYSNFLENANRGALAEFIIASALGVIKPPYSSWESYDMEIDGIKVEVKASGYLQTWEQKQHTTPSFDVGKKRGWIGDTSELMETPRRHADVYVFYLHHEKNTAKKKANPLDTKNWSFWVVETKVLNEKLGDQKSVSISTLKKYLGIQAVQFEEVKKLIKKLTPPS